MSSLVGYGVSSESDYEGDVEDVNNSGVGPPKEMVEVSAVKRTRNFLLEPGSGSSESEEEEPQPSSAPARPQPTLSVPTPGSLTSSRLPPPSLSTSFDSSVFSNPFKAQVDQKLSVLQKHVPLTVEAKPAQIGGKKMCVSYRKDGRCRFGIKCKFAHDSDLQNPVAPTDCQVPLTEGTSASDQAGSNVSARDGGSQNRRRREAKEESAGQQVKKRRVGLSNTLIPSKRVMKQYAMQRDREQINMS